VEINGKENVQKNKRWKKQKTETNCIENKRKIKFGQQTGHEHINILSQGKVIFA
jgi:hypothetical protein